MSIKKNRCFLLALFIAIQAACLGFGVAWATGWLWGNFEEVVNSSITSQGKALACELTTKTMDLQVENIQPGSSGWQQVQALCEQTSVPYKGFACVMRYDNGAMVCHPNLNKDPGLLRLFPGNSLILGDQVSGSITSALSDAVADNKHFIQGKVELDGDVYFVTAHILEHLNAVLAVYQSDMAADLFVISTIQPIMQIGYTLTTFIVGATAIITLFLISRYEASLIEAEKNLSREVEQRTRVITNSRNAIVFGLAKLVESRDRDTSIHLERMRSYVTILASEMAKSNAKINYQYVSDLAVSSSLHDIGKIGIPDSVLMKDGPLSPSERNAMEMHTVLGADSIQAIFEQLEEAEFLGIAREIAIAHHENWDGSGYPAGLQGKDIPLSARIVALADVYDALTSTRPYKRPVSHQEARDWIATAYAEKFDPAVVEAFIARENDFQRVLNSLAAKPYEHPTTPQKQESTSVLPTPLQLLR